MGRVKAGFENGDIVVCIDAAYSSFLTQCREYEVISYWHMDRRYKNADERFPAVIIYDDSFMRKVIPCRYFMPKGEYLVNIRNSRISSVLNKA